MDLQVIKKLNKNDHRESYILREQILLQIVKSAPLNEAKN
jgi:hypothetical protein